MSTPDVEEINPRSVAGADDDSLGAILVHYWRLARTYYWLLLLVCIAGVTGAYYWTKQQPKIYQTSSKIVYHNSRGNILGRNIEQVELLNPGGRWQFEQFWHTQKEVLRANWFLERVAKREGLLDNPKFMPDPPDGQTRSKEEAMQLAAGRISGMTDISLQRDSRVGVVTVRSKHPELATTLANGVADAYIEYTKEFQSGGMERITNWFDQYVAKKRTELEEAQTKLQKFQRDNNILSLSYEDRQKRISQNIEAVNGQLQTVQGKLSAEEALLEQIRTMEQSGDDLNAIADLVENEALKKLFAREAELEQELADLKTRYMAKHPQVSGVQEQLKVVRKNIQSEINRIRSATSNKVAVLRRQKGKLQGQLRGLEQQLAKLDEVGVEYGQLKHRAENLEEVYDTVLKRSSELNINSRYQRNDIEVLEHATVPENPVSPSLPMNLALGLLLGLSLGAGGTILLDTLDTTIKSEEDVEKYTDKPILAMLPKLDAGLLRGLETIGESAADTITHTAPKSSFAEGIKTLRTNLTFMSPDNPPETLLVTSPGPSEGKTLTSVNMAIAMAQSGQKTIIVDTDLRRPRLHKALGVEKKGGVTSVVTRGEPLETQVQSTVVDNLDALACGEVPPNPSELLHSEKFEGLLDQLRANYDRVIFDSPPLVAVSDALVLSQSVDGVLMMVEFAQTRRETLRHSLEQLHGIGAPLLGLVLNEVSARSGRYGYGTYRYEYYGERDDENRPPGSRMAS